MLLSRLAETRTALAATRSRNAKRDLIADVYGDATPTTWRSWSPTSSGGLRQRRTGVGWRRCRSCRHRRPATLTVAEVDAAFAEIAELTGPGSASARAAAVTRAVRPGHRRGAATCWSGWSFGELRQGAMDALVQDGLAEAFGVPVTAVRRAAMLLSSTTAAAAVLLRRGAGRPGGGGAAGGHRDSADAGGQRAGPGGGDRQDRAAGAGGPQAGRGPGPGSPGRGEVRVFTRSLDDITDRLPGVAEVVRALPHARWCWTVRCWLWAATAGRRRSRWWRPGR